MSILSFVISKTPLLDRSFFMNKLHKKEERGVHVELSVSYQSVYTSECPQYLHLAIIPYFIDPPITPNNS